MRCVKAFDADVLFRMNEATRFAATNTLDGRQPLEDFVGPVIFSLLCLRAGNKLIGVLCCVFSNVSLYHRPAPERMARTRFWMTPQSFEPCDSDFKTSQPNRYVRDGGGAGAGDMLLKSRSLSRTTAAI
jgi:hypothetical protein